MGQFRKDINSLLKIPYKHDGKTPEEGLTCFTFILYYFDRLDLYATFKIPPFDRNWWQQEHCRELFTKILVSCCASATLYKNGEKPTAIPINALIGFPRFGDCNKITHGGIYSGDNKFIHCTESRGVVISQLNPMAQIKFVGEMGGVA